MSIGDSLTTGFQSPSKINPNGHYYPYTRILESLAWKKLKELEISNIGVIFENEGVNGESVSGILRRFNVSVSPHKPDYVIAWTAHVDLSSGKTSKVTNYNLRKIIFEVREIEAEPVLCSQPPIVAAARFNEKIKENNILIKKLADEEKATYVDLYTPLIDEEGCLRLQYSNDSIHLSNEGYTIVAKILFEKVVEPALIRLKFKKQ